MPKLGITRRGTGAVYIIGLSTSFASFDVLVFPQSLVWFARPVILVVMYHVGPDEGHRVAEPG